MLHLVGHHVSMMLLSEHNYTITLFPRAKTRLRIIISTILREFIVCSDLTFMGVHFIVFDGQANCLKVFETLNLSGLGAGIILVLSYTARLAHQLSNNLIHDFDALAVIVPSSPVAIINGSIAFFRMVHWGCSNFFDAGTIPSAVGRSLLLKD